jgi:hypothetical protein
MNKLHINWHCLNCPLALSPRKHVHLTCASLAINAFQWLMDEQYVLTKPKNDKLIEYKVLLKVCVDFIREMLIACAAVSSTESRVVSNRSILLL